MADDWRKRLEEGIAKSGRSYRSISLAIGRAAGFVHAMLRDGKEPGLGDVILISKEIGLSPTWVVYGVEMSATTERLFEIFARLSPAQREDFLRMAESAAALAAKSAAPSE